MRVIDHIKLAERRFDQKLGLFVKKHTIIGYIILFVLIPIFVLFSVCVSTMLIMYIALFLF